MGKIPYCGKEVRKTYVYVHWTPEMLDEVRRLKAEGLTNEDVAEEFGVSRAAVLNALARHNMFKEASTALVENRAT